MIADISIVIVNYNVKELVLQCLDSIYKNKYEFEVEVIVIDNNSVDDSVDAIRSKYPAVILIENKFNGGFPFANNQAFKIAKGKYIFMLNPDTELLDDALSKLYFMMEKTADVSLCAPQLLNTDLTFQQSVWRFPTVINIFCEMHYLNFLLGKKNYADKNLNEPFEAESFSGAAIFFRRSVFNKIGMLDETMFWIEDIEFCYRAHQENMRLLYFPEAKVLHHIGQSAKKNYKISLSNQIFNKVKFFGKHHTGMEQLLVKILSFYHVFIKLVVFGLISPFNVVYKRKASAYAYTLLKVFNPPIGIK